MGTFRVFHLHGLGSSCESTKAQLVKELTENLGGEFYCHNFNYLKEGAFTWEVVETLKGWLKTDKPFVLVGSSMGAYSWSDFLVQNRDIFESENLKRVILITPPPTLFDNLEKWNPIFGKEKMFLRYGEDYVYPYPLMVKLIHHDLKWANQRLLLLAEEKVHSIIAKRDTVVNNEPFYNLLKVAKKVNYTEIDDEHHLRNRIGELKEVLKNLLEETVKSL
jgi:pimeloyl-ACP methyl ester carboxylesterase